MSIAELETNSGETASIVENVPTTVQDKIDILFRKN
jgi:hypothetical protein